MMFDRVFAQELPKKILETALRAGKVSHGYIFYGQKGVGKTTLATEFAKAIICERKTGCGVCAACKQFYSTSDIRVIEGEKSISVSDIREITTEIYLKPFQFEKKIYIIRDAEKMTVQAQNALLKVFEEPPAYAVMILVTSNLSMILPTILSRGVQVRFQPLSPGDIKAYFQSIGKNAVPEDVISGANGSITAATELLESENYREMREKVIADFGRLLQGKTGKDVLRLYGDFLTYEDSAPKLLDILNSLVYDSICPERELLKNKDCPVKANISLAAATAIYGELSDLAARLSTNAAYAVNVLSALIRIGAHLNRERI